MCIDNFLNEHADIDMISICFCFESVVGAVNQINADELLLFCVCWKRYNLLRGWSIKIWYWKIKDKKNEITANCAIDFVDNFVFHWNSRGRNQISKKWKKWRINK